MVKDEIKINGCLKKLKELEIELDVVLKADDIRELPFLRQKIKQQKEKLRTVQKEFS